MANLIEVTQISAIEYRNTAETLLADFASGASTPTFRGKVIQKFHEVVNDPNSKLNKELGGLTNVRTIRAMQSPQAKGEDKPFELVFALKTPENVLKAEANKRAEEERKKKLQDEKLKRAHQSSCASHPEYKAKFPPKADCKKCKDIYNRKQAYLAKTGKTPQKRPPFKRKAKRPVVQKSE